VGDTASANHLLALRQGALALVGVSGGAGEGAQDVGAVKSDPRLAADRERLLEQRQRLVAPPLRERRPATMEQGALQEPAGAEPVNQNAGPLRLRPQAVPRAER